jgi:hypothetical protein
MCGQFWQTSSMVGQKAFVFSWHLQHHFRVNARDDSMQAMADAHCPWNFGTWIVISMPSMGGGGLPGLLAGGPAWCSSLQQDCTVCRLPTNYWGKGEAVPSNPDPCVSLWK